MAFRPGNHDRAWNDPPVFSYQSTASSESSKSDESTPNQNSTTTTAPRRTLLNKRVPFPLSDGSTAPAQKMTSPANLPPSILVPPVIAAAVPTLLSKQLDSTSTETSEELEASLLKVSNALSNNVKNFLESDKQGDFNKRLQNLYTSWKEGKLNPDIRSRLDALCNFLDARDFGKAENIQVSLAVDYITECASWITVIKNIITEMKKKLLVDQ